LLTFSAALDDIKKVLRARNYSRNFSAFAFFLASSLTSLNEARLPLARRKLKYHNYFCSSPNISHMNYPRDGGDGKVRTPLQLSRRTLLNVEAGFSSLPADDDVNIKQTLKKLRDLFGFWLPPPLRGMNY
jgi:hypothetical protein